jgi:hypothetical protein
MNKCGLLLLLVILSCSSRKIQMSRPDLRKGEVLERINCARDTTQTYALYLPSYYNIEKKWPIIYFFDAHAKGKVPIHLYKDWAEKYGYIIAGSNYSQNGMPLEIIQNHITLFRDDTSQKLSIDNQRVYTAGFSGGAKVASSVAIFDGGVRGVIGCGAGFPALDKPITRRFHFIGFVGNEDFNMASMKFLDESLQQSGFRHQLVIFDGRHEWPAKEWMQQAFWWLQVNEMKDHVIPQNDTLLGEIVQSSDDQIATLQNQKKMFEIYMAYQHMIDYVNGLADVSHYIKQLDSLANSALIRRLLKEKNEIQALEEDLQQNYVQALTSKNEAWWISEVRRLNQAAKDSGNVEAMLMHRRLINFLSLIAYSNSTGALNANEYVSARTFLKIYALVDPKNPEHRYLSACMYMKLNQADKALSGLKEAVALGFDDLKRLQNDETFLPLREKREYSELLFSLSRPE